MKLSLFIVLDKVIHHRFFPNWCYNFILGVKNLIAWFPIIWRDRWWDWNFLASVLEFKLRRDARGYAKYGVCVRSKYTARQMLICAELLKRLQEEGLDSKQNDYYLEYLSRLMNKHLLTWWD